MVENKWTSQESIHLHVLLRDRRYKEAREDLPVERGNVLWNMMAEEMNAAGYEWNANACKSFWISKGKIVYKLDVDNDHLQGEVVPLGTFTHNGVQVTCKVQPMAKIGLFNVMHTMKWEEFYAERARQKLDHKHMRINNEADMFPKEAFAMKEIAKQVVKCSISWAVLEDVTITGPGKQNMAIMEVPRPTDDDGAAIQDMFEKISEAIELVKRASANQQPAGLKIEFI